MFKVQKAESEASEKWSDQLHRVCNSLFFEFYRHVALVVSSGTRSGILSNTM